MRTRTLLTPQRWQRLQAIFDHALPLDPDARARYLLEECGDDIALREQVVSLLIASTDDAGEFEQHFERAIAATLRESELPAGTIVGRYRISSTLGSGGMGSVYLAERADEQYHQVVALKLVSKNVLHAGASGRFRGERQILARLNHPNIARLLDGGHTEDGAPYLVMEYVEGLHIDRYCEQHRLDTVARLRLMQQVCAAVQYAHQNLVVHRDLKPSNLLVTADGTPKLLDFGIAKLLDTPASDPASALTRGRERVLTPEYASPEQLRGESIDTVADVYTLGVLLYLLLTGKNPNARPELSLYELERAVCERDPPAPSIAPKSPAAPEDVSQKRLARNLAGDLDNIVLRAMHRDPRRRYVSAAALAQDIQNHLEGRPVQARPDTWAYRTGKFLRRNRVAAASGTAAVLVLFTVVGFYTARLAAERDTAERERQVAASVEGFLVEAFRLANPSQSQGNNVTVRQLLDAAAARIERDLPGQPRLRLTLMRDMGEAYSGLGLWAEARSLLDKAVAQERETFGNRHVELARALATLGDVCHNLAQLEDAQKALNDAWSIRSALRLDRTVEGVRLLHSMAANLRSQQRFDEAVQLHQRAERYARALVPADSSTLGLVLQGYAMTYWQSGDLKNSERYARESLPLVRGVVHQGIDLYGNSLAALAVVVGKQYRLAEAKPLHDEFIKRQVALFGPNNLLVGRAWNNYATLLRAMGNYTEAERAFDEGLRIFELQKGSAGVDGAVAHHNLGGLHHEAGDLPAALKDLEIALKLKRQTTGERSPQTVSTLVEIASVLRDLGRLNEARTVLDEARSVAAEKFDRDDRRHVTVLVEKGKLELAAGNLTQAEADLKQAVVGLQSQDDPARLADAMANMGESLVREGRAAEARSVLSDALALRRKVLPAEHWAIADAESRLGEALLLSGEETQGKELLSHALTELRARRPAGDVFTLAAERRMHNAPATVRPAVHSGNSGS